MQKSYFIILLSVATLVLAFTFFNKTSTPSAKLPTITESPKVETKLEDTLYLLAKAENPTQFARAYNLDIKNNSVQVVIETNDSFTLPQDFGTVETTSQNLIQARVKIDKLLELAKYSQIRNVRLPTEAQSL